MKVELERLNDTNDGIFKCYRIPSKIPVSTNFQYQISIRQYLEKPQGYK